MNIQGTDDALANAALNRREREYNERRWTRTDYRFITWTVPDCQGHRRTTDLVVDGITALACIAVISLLALMVAP